MNKCLKYTLIGGCGIPCLVVVCGIIGVFVMIARIECVHKHGLNYVSAQHKYFMAMQEGNAPEAVSWAKRTYDYAKKENKGYAYESSKRDIARALELNGKYEEAKLNYTAPARNMESVRAILDIPRVEYKLGQKEEAFQGYCQYANRCLIKYHEMLKGEWWNDRNRALGEIRYPITLEQDGYFMWLSPFLKYKDFLNFMEEEYKKLGEPQEYAAAMELFRAIDKEIVEVNLPQSGASDKLDAMRKKILAERKEKGAKW